ncbi:MAG: hypothetical protein KDC71_22385 [Acidobacteria bacterium]|nr:hypothetical protein [Acidobacteriota bacterium]
MPKAGVFFFLCLALPLKLLGQEKEATNPFSVLGFLAYGVDSFAAGELKMLDYEQADQGNDTLERLVGGISFHYQIKKFQIYGTTIHGMRSGEEFTENPNDDLVRVIRNSTSLEALLGLKYQLLPINAFSAAPAKLYLNLQAGFLTVSKLNSDVIDNHELSFGLQIDKNKYAGSYLDIGFGRNDLFVVHPQDRWKIEGMVTWQTEQNFRPFLNFRADTDLGYGSDSVQISLGFAWDLTHLPFLKPKN